MFNAHRFVLTVAGCWLVAFVVLAAIAVPTGAQAPAPFASDVGSFRGRIFDADTGQPVTQEVTIAVYPGGSDTNRRVLDVTGEFVVSDLPLGRSRLSFRKNGYSFETPRTVHVTGLSALTPVDIYLRIPGEITGFVVDREGEPVQGSRVMLVTVEYLAGRALYTAFGEKQTDDRGYFRFWERTEAGRPYFMLVLPPEATRPTLSGTPAFEATWYPGRPGQGQPFVLRSGERQRVDLIVERRQTHCVDGRMTKNGQPAALNFEIAIPEVAGYRGSTGGTQGVIFRGQSDASGHFQACGLWPGEFLIAAGMNAPPVGSPPSTLTADSYGRATVSVVDRDVHDVILNAQAPVTLNAEIRLDSAQPGQETYRLSFTPLSRVAFESQTYPFGYMNVAVPSQFTVPLLPSTDYMVGLNIPGGASNTYLKEVTCGGAAHRNTIKLGDADCGLRITVGTDMGKLAATIVDQDNNNDLNSSVCVFPVSAVTREEIALTGTCSSIDPETTTASIALRPDRYFAVAVPPEVLDWEEYILTNRSQAELIDIGAYSTIPLTLKSNTGR